MTHETLAAYERYADQLEDMRRTDAEWASVECWMETLVELCRDSGDGAAERFLRERLRTARLHREVLLRCSRSVMDFS